MICVVIGRTRHKMMQIEVVEAGKRGAPMIELRLDFLAKAPDYKRILDIKPCPIVATVRRPQDGGRWKGSEAERQMLLRQATVSGFDWVDIETDIAGDVRRFKDVKRIISYHNMREVPEDLETIHARMCTQDADVVKIAVTAQQPSDNLRVLKLMHEPPKPTIAFCMGEIGTPSRILAAKFGAPFTYAAFNKERGVAPGILSYEDLKYIYHYDQIKADTKVFGVIGDPVSHSLSPIIHNVAFQKLGINAVYLPFRVPRGNLARFLKEHESLPVSGYSVTIPHKEAALHAAIEKEAEAEAIGAANTLVRAAEGFAAYNTDYQAAKECLLANLPPAVDGSPVRLNVLTVLILGAGGAARSLAYMLQKEGARVTIANRTLEKAQDLAAAVGCAYTPWETRHDSICDLLINCTSVGMHPNIDETPVHYSFLQPGLKVFDTVYTPEKTMLIKEAQERNCYVITGVDMFVRQAALQFGLFTGQKAPFQLMEEATRRALSPVTLRPEDK